MILVICGPTGVGKTKLSILLAKRYNGIIINADACQFYQGMDIGTAKIKESEKEGIKHYLLDNLTIDDEYNIWDFQKEGRKIIEDNKDKNIIIVGGSGLYLSALLYDYKYKKQKEIDLSKYSNEELYEKVIKINPEANIDQFNRRRLENYLKTGIVNAEKPKLLYDALFIGLTTDRNFLYNKIDTRVDEMLKNGLINEVKKLYTINPNSRILNSAIGYKEVIKYLNNEISLDECINLIKKNSRHYAKRQYTWFNNKMNIKWFNTNYNNFNLTTDEVVNYIENSYQKR